MCFFCRQKNKVLTKIINDKTRGTLLVLVLLNRTGAEEGGGVKETKVYVCLLIHYKSRYFNY